MTGVRHTPKLTMAQANQARMDYAHGGVTIATLAKTYHVSYNVMAKLLRGETYWDEGYHERIGNLGKAATDN